MSTCEMRGHAATVECRVRLTISDDDDVAGRIDVDERHSSPSVGVHQGEISGCLHVQSVQVFVCKGGQLEVDLLCSFQRVQGLTM